MKRRRVRHSYIRWQQVGETQRSLHGCKGQALEFTKHALRTRGFEAWRRLVKEFWRSRTAALIELGVLLKFDVWTTAMFRANLFKCERAMTQYVAGRDERSVYGQVESRCGADGVAKRGTGLLGGPVEKHHTWRRRMQRDRLRCASALSVA